MKRQNTTGASATPGRGALLLACALLLQTSAWCAQERILRPPRLVLTLSEEDGLVEVDEPLTFTATIDNRSRSTLHGRLTWAIHSVACELESPAAVELTLEGGQTRALEHRLALPAPGFVDVECVLEYGDSGARRSDRTRVGYGPAGVRSALTRARDFDDFWRAALAELASVEPGFEAQARPAMDSPARQVFEVSMRSVGGVCVRGWLEVPRAEGPHPVLVRLPGYGQDMRPIGSGEDLMVLSFNPRGHGNSQDQVPGRPVDYWIRGLDDKATYFYRGAYLDCVRAIDFVAGRGDVDTGRIAVWGGSQGGGFAFATAALDPRVDLCLADIPFLCDWINYFKLSDWPEMNAWIEAREERTWASTLQTLSYFDTLNLAGRIRCPTLMGVGLQDRVCPPTTSFAAFNRIPAAKAFHVYSDRAHGLDQRHRSLAWDWLRSAFELDVSVGSDSRGKGK